jgi:formate dehydrogenase subunit gamma
MNPPVTVRELVESSRERIGGPLTALRTLVDAYGHLEPSQLEVVADVFNLSLAEVRGIVSFYADLYTAPRGRRLVRICQAEACQARGARALTAAAEAEFGVALGETAADLSVSLEPVYCLGVCAAGPSALVDGRIVVDATLEHLK